jgi:ribosomal protein S18 acetylase RimI-like enzyme
LKIQQASIGDVEAVSVLFDAYRQFYQQAPAIDDVRGFISQRLEQEDSTIFLATENNTALGFLQLYPSFTSVGMAPTFVLNDLYVSSNARGQGVATLLMNEAATYATKQGAKRLDLATELTNTTAQALYEKLGWVKNTSYFHYSLSLG